MKNILFLICILLAGCSSEEAPQQDAGTEETKPAISPDSLRQLYAEYQAAQNAPMPVQQQLEKGKLYPVDEAPLDTVFFVFRQQLMEQLEDKSVFGLLDAVAEDVKVEGAKQEGMPGFVSFFRLDSKEPDILAVWRSMQYVLMDGGAFSNSGRHFAAPYYAATWPDTEYAPGEHVVITGTGVRLRNAPSLNSQTLSTISFNPIVKLLSYGKEEEVGGQMHPWVQIGMESGAKGYVYGQFVGNPSGPRLTFTKQAGRWQLSEVAGF